MCVEKMSARQICPHWRQIPSSASFSNQHPSLVPEQRLASALTKEGACRGLLLWHALVLARLRKILNNPLSFLSVAEMITDNNNNHNNNECADEHSESRSCNFLGPHEGHEGRSTRRTPSHPQNLNRALGVSDNGAAGAAGQQYTGISSSASSAIEKLPSQQLHSMGIQMAKSVLALWEQHGVVCAPEDETEEQLLSFSREGNRYVHACVVEKPLHVSMLNISQNDKNERERLMVCLSRNRNSTASRSFRRSSTEGEESAVHFPVNRGNQGEDSISTPHHPTSGMPLSFRSTPALAPHGISSDNSEFVLPDSVLTLPFSVVRRALHQGCVSLLG